MSDLNFMVGTISYLPDDGERTDRRIEIYNKELRWLESLNLPFEYYRVESAWGEKAKAECTTTLDLHSIVTEQHPPGYNRNLLLEKLYASDYDWLVCMDDDRRLYPMYNGDAFFKDLGTPKVVDLAKRGYLITCFPPSIAPFKKGNCSWQYKEDNWYMERESCYGFLQICFIPNLVKFGFKPVYFNGETACLEGDAPEDVQFQLDWLVDKHPIIRNRNLILEEIGQSNGGLSTIYRDAEHRQEVAKTQAEWMKTYLKTKLPRKPQLWNKTELAKRVNPAFTELIPRGERYEFSGRDLPKE